MNRSSTALALLVMICFVFGLLRLNVPYQRSTTSTEKQETIVDRSSVSGRFGDATSFDPGSDNYLFIGNSHTHSHDVPGRVAALLKLRFPERTIVSHAINVPFLDDAANDESLSSLIAKNRWQGVLLQAQKISSSGRYEYSTDAGIHLAKGLVAKGTPVYFFAEWGLQGVADSTERTDRIYRNMSMASGAMLIPVGLVWENVLRNRTDLSLFDLDGNHSNALGADLTALAIASFLSGEDPMSFEPCKPSHLTAEQWSLFCRCCQVIWSEHSSSLLTMPKAKVR